MNADLLESRKQTVKLNYHYTNFSKCELTRKVAIQIHPHPYFQLFSSYYCSFQNQLEKYWGCDRGCEVGIKLDDPCGW